MMAECIFNPEDSLSIANAVKILIEDSKLRSSLAVRSKVLAGKYSWERCAKETWNYLQKISKEFKEFRCLKKIIRFVKNV